MKQLIAYLSLVGALFGCATVDYQSYEGKTKIYEGEGGTKVVSDGVEFWANGSPPKKYTIIGMAKGEVSAGIGDESIIRSAVAEQVKKQGGNAAIQVTNNTSFAGLIRTSPNMFVATDTKTMQFAVIKYVE